jgi:hypothetical protein
MEMMEALKRALQEGVIPERDRLQQAHAGIQAGLAGIPKRLDDINLPMADRSRRIDQTNKRIVKVQDDLIQRFDQTHLRIDGVREELAELKLRLAA